MLRSFNYYWYQFTSHFNFCCETNQVQTHYRSTYYWKLNVCRNIQLSISSFDQDITQHYPLLFESTGYENTLSQKFY